MFGDNFLGRKNRRSRSARKASKLSSQVTRGDASSIGHEVDGADVPPPRRSILELIRIIFRISPTRFGRNKSIVQNETLMFGKTIDEHVDEKSGVSLFVFWCVTSIENTVDHIYTDALYRVSGSKQSVELIVGTEKENMVATLNKEQNIHVLTGALKKFFMLLKKPLLVTENFRFQNQDDSESKSAKISNYRQALNLNLKHEENCTLQFFLRHLLRVAAHKHENNMDVPSIATVIGPNLVRSSQSSDINLQIHVTQFILENYCEIFSTYPQHQDRKDSAMRRFKRESFDVHSDSPNLKVDVTGQGKFRQVMDQYFADTPRRPTQPMKVPENDVPMFGGYLQDAVDGETGASKFVVWCVDAVETTGENLKTDALYRASGNQAKVQEIAATDVKHMKEKLENEANVHVLTGALKLYFRQLKAPLLDHQIFKRLTLYTKDEKTDACREARTLFEKLQSVEWSTLKCIMKHMKTVLENKASNKMGVEGLGVVFGPTLMRLPDDSHDMAGDMKQQARIIEFFLANYDDIFSP